MTPPGSPAPQSPHQAGHPGPPDGRGHDDEHAAARHETEAERMDRNWD